MTEYVAFLRGINVGGHGAGTMEDLKKAFGKGITTRTWDMINRLVK